MLVVDALPGCNKVTVAYRRDGQETPNEWELPRSELMLIRTPVK
jgi:hypothetical protein